MNDDTSQGLRYPAQEDLVVEKKVLLRALVRVRVYCDRCPIESRGFHLDPCYGCIILPPECGRLMTTVN